MTAIAVLQATLRAVLADDPDGCARALACVPSPRVGSCETPQGPVVTVDHRKLHSGRDPEGEARRFVRELDLADATAVILLGYGSGYVARAIAARCSATLFVFEPDVEQLVVGLQHGPVPPRMHVITTPTRLGEVLYARLASHDRGVLAKWTPSLRVAPAVYEAGLHAAAHAIDRAALRHRTARMRGPGWLRHYLENLPALARWPGLPAMAGGLAGVPAVVVAAGPSLDKSIAALRERSDDALILAVNTAAGALAKAGIRPHAIVAIESLDVSTQLAALPFLREVPAFLELTGHPALWQLPFAQKIPISVDTNACVHFSARVDPRHHLAAGFCVANAAVAIAYALGCGPIALVGSDLAYAGDRVYADGTAFADMRVEIGSDGTAALRGLEGKRAIESASHASSGGARMPDTARTLAAPGWYPGTEVVTTRDFLMFRDWYAASAKTLRAEGIRPVNATEGGAHIPGWDHVPLAAAIDAGSGIGVGERFAALLRCAPSSPAKLAELVAQELAACEGLLTLAQTTTATLGDDPDGDLTLDADTADAIVANNLRVRTLLRSAPLVAEALAVPIDDLRTRGRITSHGFYAAMLAPLRELSITLARLSQRLASEQSERVHEAAGTPLAATA